MADSDQDWAWLPKDIVALILTKLTEFSDYVRFNGVCAPWRYIAMEEDNNLDHKHALQKQMFQILRTCHNQLPMLMLFVEDDCKHRHNLYSVTEQRFYDLHLQLPSKRSYFGSSLGWLFAVEERDMSITLFNPFTRQTIHLPVLEYREFEDWFIEDVNLVHKGILSSDPRFNPNNYEVALIFGEDRRLAFFKSGDVAWTYITPKDDCQFSDCIYHKGQFYAVDDSVGIFHIDFASGTESVFNYSGTAFCASTTYLVEPQEGDVLLVKRFSEITDQDDDPIKAHSHTLEFNVFKLSSSRGQTQPTLVEINSLGNAIRANRIGNATFANTTYLVESQEGDVLVIRRFYKITYKTWIYGYDEDEDLIKGHTLEFKVFKLSNSCGQTQPTLVRIYSLGDQALFLGHNHSVSVLVSDFPRCRPNCIYYVDDLHRSHRGCYPHRPNDDSGVFNIENERFESHYMPYYSEKNLHPPIWIMPNLRGK